MQFARPFLHLFSFVPQSPRERTLAWDESPRPLEGASACSPCTAAARAARALGPWGPLGFSLLRKGVLPAASPRPHSCGNSGCFFVSVQKSRAEPPFLVQWARAAGQHAGDPAQPTPLHWLCPRPDGRGRDTVELTTLTRVGSCTRGAWLVPPWLALSLSRYPW